MRNAYLALALITAMASVPAQASVVAWAPSGNGVISLHGERGWCQGAARQAEYVEPGAETIRGCWVPIQGGVMVLFFDGDTAGLPTAALRKPSEG